MRMFGILALLALSATGAARAQVAGPTLDTDGLELRLSGDGFGAGNPGLDGYASIRFGIGQTETIRRISRMAGRLSATGISRACGAHPLAFARFNKLTLYFRNRRFVGWSLVGPRTEPMAVGFLESEWGLGIGTPRREIYGEADNEPVFHRTAQGITFDTDGMHGLLSGRGPRAQVAMMWTGESCRGR